MASLISAYSGYVALSFLPPVIWLLFYLHEDRHPEPKQLILLTFAAGVISAIFAAILEIGIFSDDPRIFKGLLYSYYPRALSVDWVVLLGVALIEECLKYAAVKFAVLSRPEFDEPVDAMIYMITAALGFAAIENVVLLIPIFEQSLTGGIELTATRFVGANLLHALSSAIVGYFIARHIFSPWRRHAIFAGIVLATVLHALFNYLIIIKDVIPASLTLVILLLSLMAVSVFVDFERLKRKQELADNSGPPKQ